MPIESSEWSTEKKFYSLKEKILLFLRENPEKAFNIKEIVKGTGYSLQVVLQGYGDAPESEFMDNLNTLMEEGLVEIRKSENRVLYYKATKKAIENIPTP